MTVEITSKLDQLKNMLRKEITSGKRSVGDRFPSDNELSAQYKIGRSTVREALSSLVHEGLLVRIQGKGTFVAEKKREACPVYGVIVKTEGHLFGPQSQCLIQGLQKRGAMTIVVDSGDFSEGVTRRKNIMRGFEEHHVAGFIIDGFYNFPFEGFAKSSSGMKKMLFLNRFEHRFSGCAERVLSNPARGAELALDHLYSLGRRRIGFAIFPKIEIERASGCYDLTEHAVFTAAYQNFAREKGIPEFTLETPLNEETMRPLLTGKKRVDAFFVYTDTHAVELIRIAMKLGLKVPDDLAVIGYYNTPWVGKSPVPLASVSVREQDIAKIAVERLLVDDNENKTTIIEPELIIRESAAR